MSAEPFGRPEPILRAVWKAIPAARPVTQEHVDHADLLLGLCGPGAGQIKKSHHEHIPGDPYYIWSGKCIGAWALTLRHRSVLIDLSRAGLIRWRARQSGSRRLRLLVKPEQGPWLVSEAFDGASTDWHEFEIEIASTDWRRFDIETCTAQTAVTMRDALPGEPSAHSSADDAIGLGFDRIDAVGVTDLMPGGGSDNCSRLDWIEVWGRAVPRASPL